MLDHTPTDTIDRISAAEMLMIGDDASGDRRLWANVIIQAVRDAVEKHVIGCTTKPLADHARAEARRWFERGGPDFAEVCMNAGLDPDVIRDGALDFIAKADQSDTPIRVLHLVHLDTAKRERAALDARKQEREEARTLARLAAQLEKSKPKPAHTFNGRKSKLTPEERRLRKLDQNARQRARRAEQRRQQEEQARALGLFRPKPPKLIPTPKPPRPQLTAEERLRRKRERNAAYAVAHRDRLNEKKRLRRQAMREAQQPHDAKPTPTSKPTPTPKPPRIVQTPEERKRRKAERMARYREANRDQLNEQSRLAYLANLERNREARREHAARRRQAMKQQHLDHTPAE